MPRPAMSGADIRAPAQTSKGNGGSGRSGAGCEADTTRKHCGDVAQNVAKQIRCDYYIETAAPTLASSLAVGAVGAILAFANAAPYATISIWEAHRTREPEAALDWQNRI